MEKQKLIFLFNEVLQNWKSAQDYVIQDSFCSDDDYGHEELEKDINNYKQEFLEALNS